MKTLILGGTRFIGPVLVKELLARGHEVAVLNRGLTEATLPAEVQRLCADRNDPASMREALAGRSFDAVLDLSGYTADQVQAALEALAGRVGHYLFTSSTAVYYGSAIYPIREHDRLMPDERGGSYGWNKVRAERLLAHWSQNTGMPFTVIRPAYVYGPGNSNLGREPSYFYRQEQRRPLLLPTRGIPLAHLVHVQDLAQLFAQCLGNPRSYGQAYNGVGPDYASLRGWFQSMAEAVGVEPTIVNVPDDLTPMMRSFPYQTRRCVLYSFDKAVRDLDYRPRYDTRAGIADSYAWYKQALSGTFTWDLTEDEAILAEMRKRELL
ncbi:MAG: SDR family oxidoreductase [Chloroflexi bacterium]|nr:SDR family oxidoreductase [Chloroflexota bacterium]